MLFLVKWNPPYPAWTLFLQFLNHVLNWMFQCQDVIRSKSDFTLAEVKLLNKNSQSATLLKKRPEKKTPSSI